jgi:hypothetical protein
MLKRTLVFLLLAVACTAAVQAPGQTYTPTQSAYLKGELKRIQERFVAQVSGISGVPKDTIRQWVPTDGQDVPPKVNVVQALQRSRGKPLTEEEKAKVAAAEEERFQAVEQARARALQK